MSAKDSPTITIRIILAFSLSLLSEGAFAADADVADAAGDDILLGTVIGIILKGGLSFILNQVFTYAGDSLPPAKSMYMYMYVHNSCENDDALNRVRWIIRYRASGGQTLQTARHLDNRTYVESLEPRPLSLGPVPRARVA